MMNLPSGLGGIFQKYFGQQAGPNIPPPAPVNPGLLEGRGFQMPSLPTPQAPALNAPAPSFGSQAMQFLQGMPQQPPQDQQQTMPPPGLIMPQQFRQAPPLTRPGMGGLFGGPREY